MIIIQKKRIQIILTCILISIFAFTFQIADQKQEEKKSNNTNETTQVTATPVSGKTIVIDAGHGTPDEGAESRNRNNRSTNKLKNSTKITKTIRNKWKYSNINKIR